MELNIPSLIGVLLLILGGFGIAVVAIAKLAQMYFNRAPSAAVTVKTDNDTVASVTSTDAPSPVGIKDYVALVRNAAPSASAEVLLGYLADGLTEAGVLRAEVNRLSPKAVSQGA